jgi:hypothetical protein
MPGDALLSLTSLLTPWIGSESASASETKKQSRPVSGLHSESGNFRFGLRNDCPE